MQAHNFLNRWSELPESADLDETRRDVIVEIAVVVFGVGWLIAIAAYDGRLAYLWSAFLLMSGAYLSFAMRQHHLRVALALLIGALISAVAWLKWIAPESLAQFYFPLVVVVSSLLVSNFLVFGVATVAASVSWLIALAQGADALDQHQVILPILLIYLTAFGAWLGSRQVHLSLLWLQSSYTRARSLLDQLRDERASLAHTLKMLEEAYVRIEKMNYALIEAQSAAEHARRIKAEFAANVSHELRTPINIIIGFSETMANAPETYAGVAWSPALRSDIEQIYQSSRHLAALIDDILDLSALDAQKLGMNLASADLRAVIDDALNVVGNLYRAKNLYLRVESESDLPALRMDAVRIRQVLINLLTNASRFTRAGGVTITTQPQNNFIRIAVADTGIGIAPDNVRRVFEDFGQVDGSTAREHDGTGLGVPLSKRLVELHGGQMWLESQVDLGTTFYFTLPLGAPAVARAERVGNYPTHAYRKAVLVIEPDPIVLRLLQRHLNAFDLIAISARASLPALIAAHQPIALLMDTRAALPADTPRDLPIITIALPSSLQSAQSLGIANFLLKPVAREELLDAISALARPIRDVLVVDNEPQLVELFSRMLQSAGEMYRPIKAFGGAEALERLRGQTVDLVLLDLLMPEVDGLAVLRAMKADATLAQIPVIVISAHAERPETMPSESGLDIRLTRASGGSISDRLNLAQTLIAALPPKISEG
ncbi:MAG: response regulator [Chloroflexi bacterium]|nr:response regulator [Chloroflexota bacterium]